MNPFLNSLKLLKNKKKIKLKLAIKHYNTTNNFWELVCNFWDQTFMLQFKSV